MAGAPDDVSDNQSDDESHGVAPAPTVDPRWAGPGDSNARHDPHPDGDFLADDDIPAEAGTISDEIVDPDGAAVAAARRRQTGLLPPVGSLGRLEELAVWAAGVQGRCPPQPFRRVRVVLFAADHGIAAAGVSAHVPAYTAELLQAVAGGGAPVNVLSRATGATVRLLDLAVDSSHVAGPHAPGGATAFNPESAPGPGVAVHHVRAGSGRIDREDALTAAETRSAYATGRQVADEEVDAGADLLVPAELGVGATTPAATIVAALTGSEPVHVVGRGSGIDDNAWMRKLAAIRDALRRVRGRVEPLILLQMAGGADLAAMAGFLSQAAIRRTPVLLDGLVSTAAALVAYEATPAAAQWWLATHRTPEPAHDLALARLGLVPVVDLGVRLGQGAGALACLPLLDAAIRTLAETAPGAPA